jgi:hypothetical protein
MDQVLVKLFAAPWTMLQAVSAFAIQTVSQVPFATPTPRDSITSEEVALQAAEAL